MVDEFLNDVGVDGGREGAAGGRRAGAQQVDREVDRFAALQKLSDSPVLGGREDDDFGDLMEAMKK